jgi:hypothetical protein
MKGGGGFLHPLYHPGISPPEVMGVEVKQVVSADNYFFNEHQNG